jgi:hypothetical protein
VELPFDLRPALDVTVFGGRVLALGRTQLLERTDDGSFRVQPTGIPPGSTPKRVSAATGVVLIATDRGLVVATSASGPWQRAAAPAGSTPALDVAIAGEQALVVVRATARREPAGDGGCAFVAACRDARASCDPPILEVQRAALRYLHLAGDPAAAMRRGVRLRGLLPIVTLEGRKGNGGDRRHSYDESFVSGGYRKLYDSDDFATHDRDVLMRFTWDLGDSLYNPEQIDVSTEARRLVELRDDVLDELDQLYLTAAAPSTREAAAARSRRRRASGCAPKNSLPGSTPDGRLVRAPRRVFAALSGKHSPRSEGILMQRSNPGGERPRVSFCCGALPRCPRRMLLPLISELFYDAEGTDDGKSFVELYGTPGVA